MRLFKEQKKQKHFTYGPRPQMQPEYVVCWYVCPPEHEFIHVRYSFHTLCSHLKI